MTQKDPIWPVRELMGYRPLQPATKRVTASDNQSGGAIESLERRSMISGPISIALAAAMAPASEMHLGFDANDDFKPGPDETVATLADDDAGACAVLDNPGDAYKDAASRCRPDLPSMQSHKMSDDSEIPRTYTLATIQLPSNHRGRHLNSSHRKTPFENSRQAQHPGLALQIMASGVAIDFDQAAEVSAMLNHHALLPGIVFNPVAGIAALVA